MLSLLSGQLYRRVGNSSNRGPEYQGPCPACGGRDRFHIWPDQGSGTFWCRMCEKGGDLVEFYRWSEGLSYRDACQKAGIDAKTYTPQGAPTSKKSTSSSVFVPQNVEKADPKWSEHAEKFADWCHLQLLANQVQLDWLAARGINEGLVAQYGLGWNPTDTWRAREAWGLPTERREDGKPKKLWLPTGLVIPQREDGLVQFMQIRRPEGEPRYWEIKGSVKSPMVVNREASAFVILESRLDAILLADVAGDLVGVIAMGNDSNKPTASLWTLLQRAVHVSVSLDSDTPKKNQQTGRMEAAGASASRWWLANVPTAERVPMVGGKDPGEAFKNGVNLRAWVLAGLPPRFHLKDRSTRVQNHCADVSKMIAEPAIAREVPEVIVNHRIITLTDGREIHITDNRELWQDLTDEGVVVFSEHELQRVLAALIGMNDDERTEAVQKIVDLKQTFPGAYVRRGEVMA